MHCTKNGSIFLVTAFASLSLSQAVYAAADQTYVSSTGVNTGTTCDRAAPCATFQYAHDNTNAGGQITALDAKDYGPLVIDRGITVRANSEEASIFVTTGSAITINAPANQGVAIQGLTLRGGPTADNGILVNSVGHLGVYGVRASQFQGAAPYGFGIKVAVNNQARFIFQNLSLNGNGNATNSTGGAIQIAPQPGGSAFVTIDAVTGSRNVFGIAADGTGSVSGMNITVRNVLMTHSRVDGVIAVTPAGGAPVGLMVEHSTLSNNQFGARAIGSGVVVRLNDNTISGNTTGIASGSGGAVLSYGNNAINANGTDGTPGTVALK